MILARSCTNAKLNKTEIADKLVDSTYVNSGCLIVTDRGYSTLNTVRYFTEKKLAFMGTIQQG